MNSTVRLLIIAVLVILAAFAVDWKEVVATFSTAHLRAFAAAQPFQVASLLLVATRFGMLCKASPSEYIAVFRGYALALGMNSFVPGRLSEILKVSYINQFTTIASPSLTAAVFSEKCVDLINLSVFLILGFSFVPVPTEYKYAFLAVTFFIILVLMGLTLLTRKTPVMQKLRAREKGLAHFLGEMIREISDAMSVSTFSRIFLISLLAWISSFAVVHVILLVLASPDASLTHAFVVFAAMAIGRAIPGLPGSIGTYEAAIVFAMLPLGYNAPEALAVALTIRASQVVLVTLFGLTVLYWDGSGLSSFLPKKTKSNDENEF